MSNSKKQYRVLFPIAFDGRREKGEIIELTEEDVKRISPERIELVVDETVVEVEDEDNNGTGEYGDDDEEETKEDATTSEKKTKGEEEIK